ncbi:hypothetical protein GCM10007874_72860 [Labrys miyagiensis]|uniref:Uncharacterized protein n=1 Tax=Labrys miyagiensis TaxID=346912 RepID=A0ABQ6CYY7_9HYPH|nr:hypothetical protein GCM10007874_72860 [Labrys miyagiensis]
MDGIEFVDHSKVEEKHRHTQRDAQKADGKSRLDEVFAGLAHRNSPDIGGCKFA